MPTTRAALIAKIVTLLLTLLVVARLVAGWVPALADERRGLTLAVLALCALRFAMVLLELARGARHWQSAVFPTLMLLAVVAVLGGEQWAVLAKAAAVAGELGVLAVVLYLALAPSGSDGRPFEERLTARLRLLMPLTLARLMVTEMVILHAAFRGLLRRAKTPEGFGYTETSLARVLPLLVLFCSPVDVALIEIVLRVLHVSGPIWTLVLTASDVYALLWVYGLLVTMRERPHRIAGAALTVHKGIHAHAAIALSSIASATALPAGKRAKTPGEADLTIAGPARVALTLTGPVALTRWFVPEAETASALTISADDPRALCDAIARGRQQAGTTG